MSYQDSFFERNHHWLRAPLESGPDNVAHQHEAPTQDEHPPGVEQDNDGEDVGDQPDGERCPGN